MWCCLHHSLLLSCSYLSVFLLFLPITMYSYIKRATFFLFDWIARFGTFHIAQRNFFFHPKLTFLFAFPFYLLFSILALYLFFFRSTSFSAKTKLSALSHKYYCMCGLYSLFASFHCSQCFYTRKIMFLYLHQIKHAQCVTLTHSHFVPDWIHLVRSYICSLISIWNEKKKNVEATKIGNTGIYYYCNVDNFGCLVGLYIHFSWQSSV